MLYQQPQSGPVDLDLSGPARGTISALLPVFKSNDMVRGAVLAAPGRFTPTTTPAAFSFTSSSASVIGYTDSDSGQFRRSTFTMVLRFRLNSLTAGSIFNVDSRFNIGVGVESIPAGNLGISWYDGTFRVLSATATLGLHTLIAQATTAGMSLWLDGVLIGTTASGAIVYQGGRGCTYGAVDYFGNPGAIFDLQIANYNGLAMPSATVSQVGANPWMLLLDPDEDDEQVYAPAGAVVPSGSLVSTLAGASMASGGSTTNAGALSTTLAGATMSAAGNVGSAPAGSFASTLAGVTMAASGQIILPGALASTLAGASMASAGIVNDQGAFASSLSGASMAAAGTVAPNATGTLASTLGGVTMAAYGYNGIPPVLAGFFHRLPKNPRHVQRLP